MKSLIQDSWVDVGELWDCISAVISRLPRLRLWLLQLQQEIHQHFEGDPQAQQAARLMLEASGLSGAQAALTQQAQELWGSPMDSPESALEPLRRWLQEGKQRLVGAKGEIWGFGGALMGITSSETPRREPPEELLLPPPVVACVQWGNCEEFHGVPWLRTPEHVEFQNQPPLRSSFLYGHCDA
ncbi:uncharacterized protein ACIB01_009387 [Guaruba guarouba]